MTIEELQRLVRRCHDQHFGKTELRERLRDLTNEVGRACRDMVPNLILFPQDRNPVVTSASVH